ncbi:MAG: c-type cytochrome [Desulfuromonadales bacterium]|nr:c-type cytochrome [Desulfuromonadales bacterium]
MARVLTTMLLCGALLAPPSLAQEETERAVEARARKLINAQGCKACHPLEGMGASLAVELSDVARRLSNDELRLSLANPEQSHAAGRIGDFSHLNTAELDALVQFLASFARD